MRACGRTIEAAASTADGAPSSADVLAYINWVWSLQERERERNDPTIDWQADMSWEEMLACTGWEGRCLKRTLWLRPSDSTGDEMLNAQLYWPAAAP